MPLARLASTTLRAAVLGLAAWAGAEAALAQDLPFVPNSSQFGRKADPSVLAYCVDPRDPDWEVGKDIADAIAGALLLQPKAYVVDNQVIAQDMEDIYVNFLNRCDLYLGFKLLPDAYPEWLATTRGYYEGSYVFVTKDEAAKSLSDIPRSRPLASVSGSSADLKLIQYIQALPANNRWQRFPAGSAEVALEMVANGTVGAALVWQPAVWALQKTNPNYANLKIVSSNPLPVMSEGVGGALLSREAFIRSSIDKAIAALLSDGTIGRILEARRFPAHASR